MVHRLLEEESRNTLRMLFDEDTVKEIETIYGIIKKDGLDTRVLDLIKPEYSSAIVKNYIIPMIYNSNIGKNTQLLKKAARVADAINTSPANTRINTSEHFSREFFDCVKKLTLRAYVSEDVIKDFVVAAGKQEVQPEALKHIYANVEKLYGIAMVSGNENGNSLAKHYLQRIITSNAMVEHSIWNISDIVRSRKTSQPAP